MCRTVSILIIGVAALVMATSSWAGESKEMQEVQDLLYKEQEGAIMGKPEQILSCYAPDFVGYWAVSENPSDWLIWVVGLDELREKYANSFVASSEQMAKHPNWSHFNEVIHVNVMGNNAIAVSRHVSIQPDMTARETIRNFSQSVWTLKKSDGEWKITSFIGGVKSEQDVRKMAPE